MVRAHTRLQEGYHTYGIWRRDDHHLSASQWALQNPYQQEARGKVYDLLKVETDCLCLELTDSEILHISDVGRVTFHFTINKY